MTDDHLDILSVFFFLISSENKKEGSCASIIGEIEKRMAQLPL